MIAVEQSDWSKRDNVYSYSKIWGNGLPAPKGEDDEEDMTFSIEFEKGSKKLLLVMELGNDMIFLRVTD